MRYGAALRVELTYQRAGPSLKLTGMHSRPSTNARMEDEGVKIASRIIFKKKETVYIMEKELKRNKNLNVMYMKGNC